MAKKKQEEQPINVVDPKNFNEKELKAMDEKTKSEKEQLEARLNHVNKQIRGHLWFWWFLPIIGWLIYSLMMGHRLQREENQEKTVLIKREIAEKEIQLLLDKKRWEQLGKKPE